MEEERLFVVTPVRLENGFMKITSPIWKFWISNPEPMKKCGMYANRKDNEYLEGDS